MSNDVILTNGRNKLWTEAHQTQNTKPTKPRRKGCSERKKFKEPKIPGKIGKPENTGLIF